MSNNNRTGAFIGGMLIGSALGVFTGLLIAPRKGKDTRKILKKSASAIPEIAEDISSSVQLQAVKLSETAVENWEQTLDKLQQAIAAGIEATKKEKQALTASNAENSADSAPIEANKKV